MADTPSIETVVLASRYGSYLSGAALLEGQLALPVEVSAGFDRKAVGIAGGDDREGPGQRVRKPALRQGPDPAAQAVLAGAEGAGAAAGSGADIGAEASPATPSR